MFKLSAILVFTFIACSSGFKVHILHYNDIDSQLEAFKAGTEPPQTPPAVVGGIARLITAINTEKLLADNATEEIFTIATANLVGGQNGWLSILNWDKFGSLLSTTYKPDFMGLGLREFESGLPRTNIYLNENNLHPLVSNIDSTSCKRDTDEVKFCGNAVAYQIRPLLGGGKLGIVGFVNPTTNRLSDAGFLKFTNITDALNAVITSSEFNDVETVIAIGSGSMTIAKDIIDNVKNDKLKLVIFGGITYDMTGNFPEAYNSKYIATGLKYGQGLGKVVLEFSNGKGSVVPKESKLIRIVDQKPNLAVMSLVDNFRREVDKIGTPKIGKTLVQLEGSREACWKSECNLGNLIADSMVHCAINKLNDTTTYNNLIGIVAVWHSGAIINDVITQNSDIQAIDVHKWLPYHNNAYLVTASGSTLRRMFETSGAAINAPDNGVKDWGQFLQVSNGLEVKYNTKGDLISLKTLHVNGSKPILEDVDDNISYNFILPSILYKGKSLYEYLPGSFHVGGGGKDYTYIDFDDTCLENYIKGLQVLKIGFEERIFIGNEFEPPTSIVECDDNTAVTVILTIVFTFLIVAIIIVGYFVVWPRIQQRRLRSFP